MALLPRRHTGSKTPSGQPTTNTGEEWHIYLKSPGDDGWGPARRVTFDGEINKYPAAVQRDDGSICLFWTRYESIGRRRIPQISSKFLAAGRSAQAASLLGKEAPEEGFSFADGDHLNPHD